MVFLIRYIGAIKAPYKAYIDKGRGFDSQISLDPWVIIHAAIDIDIESAWRF